MTSKEIIEKFKQDNPENSIGTGGSYCDDHRARIIVSNIPLYLFEAPLCMTVLQKLGAEEFYQNTPKGCFCCLITTEELDEVFKNAAELVVTSITYNGNATTKDFVMFTGNNSTQNDDDLS